MAHDTVVVLQGTAVAFGQAPAADVKLTPSWAATLSFQYVTLSQPQTGPVPGAEETAGFNVHVPPAVAQLVTLQ